MDINAILDEIVTFYNENTQMVLMIITVNLLLIILYAILAHRRRNKLLLDTKKEIEAIGDDPEKAKKFLESNNTLINEEYLNQFNEIEDELFNDEFEHIEGLDEDEEELDVKTYKISSDDLDVDLDELDYTPLKVLEDEIKEDTFDYSHFDEFEEKAITDEKMQSEAFDDVKTEIEVPLAFEKAFDNELSEEDFEDIEEEFTMPIKFSEFDEVSEQDPSTLSTHFKSEDEIEVPADFEQAFGNESNSVEVEDIEVPIAAPNEFEQAFDSVSESEDLNIEKIEVPLPDENDIKIEAYFGDTDPVFEPEVDSSYIAPSIYTKDNSSTEINESEEFEDSIEIPLASDFEEQSSIYTANSNASSYEYTKAEDVESSEHGSKLEELSDMEEQEVEIEMPIAAEDEQSIYRTNNALSSEYAEIKDIDVNDYNNYMKEESEVKEHEIQESIYKEFANNFDIKDTEPSQVEVHYDLEDTYDDEEGELIDLQTLEKYDFDIQRVNEELEHEEHIHHEQVEVSNEEVNERLSREEKPLFDKVIDEDKYDSYIRKLKEFRSSL